MGKNLAFEKFSLELGNEDVKKVLKDWENIAKAIETGVRVVLPNYYLSAGPGFDLQEFLIMISEYLYEKRLMTFVGPVKYYAYYLNFSLPEDPTFASFSELYDVINEELSKYSEPYGGILAIDITDWIENDACTSKKFLEFMAFMSDLDTNTLALFVDMSSKPSLSEKALKTLSTKTRLGSIKIRLSDPKVARKYLNDALVSMGFMLNQEAEDFILPTLDAVLKTTGCEGKKTIAQMAEDIAYALARTGKPVKNILSPSDLSDFGLSGEWIKIFKENKSRQSGLFGE